MPFSKDMVERAWRRQGGLCAYCGKKLVLLSAKRGSRGAWNPHHRKALKWEGSDLLRNCVLLCINPPENCHLKIGHLSDFHQNSAPTDNELKYLYAGER